MRGPNILWISTHDINPDLRCYTGVWPGAEYAVPKPGPSRGRGGEIRQRIRISSGLRTCTFRDHDRMLPHSHWHDAHAD